MTRFTKVILVSKKFTRLANVNLVYQGWLNRINQIWPGLWRLTWLIRLTLLTKFDSVLPTLTWFAKVNMVYWIDSVNQIWLTLLCFRRLTRLIKVDSLIHKSTRFCLIMINNVRCITLLPILKQLKCGTLNLSNNKPHIWSCCN